MERVPKSDWSRAVLHLETGLGFGLLQILREEKINPGLISHRGHRLGLGVRENIDVLAICCSPVA